jgi:multiple antibiotic resistance protein
MTAMITATKVLFLIVATLFPIVDPLGGIPLFLALTPQCAPKECRALSLRVAVNSFWVLIAFYFVGSHVLAFFGVSLPVVQVGGGFLVVAFGWSMLAQKDSAPKAVQGKLSSVDLFRGAFYPLTMPVTVGPGAISVAVTLGANTAHHYGWHVLILVADLVGIALIALSVYLCYAFAGTLARVLGETGMTVIVRLSSFLLICIGVQIAWNGLSALLSTVPFRLR